MIIPLAGIDELYAEDSRINKTGHNKTQHFLPVYGVMQWRKWECSIASLWKSGWVQLWLMAVIWIHIWPWVMVVKPSEGGVCVGVHELWAGLSVLAIEQLVWSGPVLEAPEWTGGTSIYRSCLIFITWSVAKFLLCGVFKPFSVNGFIFAVVLEPYWSMSE